VIIAIQGSEMKILAGSITALAAVVLYSAGLLSKALTAMAMVLIGRAYDPTYVEPPRLYIVGLVDTANTISLGLAVIALILVVWGSVADRQRG